MSTRQFSKSHKGAATHANPLAQRGLIAATLAAVLCISQAASTQRGTAFDNLTFEPFFDRSHNIASVAITPDERDLFRIDNPARAEAIAVHSLEYSGISPSALVLLAASIREEEPDRADDVIELASRTTRRHPGVTLWEIRDALDNGELDSAMSRIDRLLLVNPELVSQVFPVLAQGLTDDDFRNLLASLFSRGVKWQNDFIFYAANDPKIAVPLAELVLQSDLKFQDAINPESFALLARSLTDANQGRMLLALAKQASSLPTDQKGEFTTFGFELLDGIAPLAWDIPTDANFGSSISRGDAQGSMNIEGWINPGYSGNVTQKLMPLAEGSWILGWERLTKRPASGASATWEISCLINGDRIQLAQSGNLLGLTGSGSLRFTTGESCPAALLTLKMRGSDGQSTAELSFEGLRLLRRGSST